MSDKEKIRILTELLDLYRGWAFDSMASLGYCVLEEKDIDRIRELEDRLRKDVK